MIVVADDWWSHPTVRQCSLAALGLWVTVACWADHQGTDEVPEHVVEFLGGTAAHAHELVLAGLWEDFEGGWLLVEWERISPRKRRRSIPRSVRRSVMERDNHTCQACGSTDDLTLDHIHPYSLGGDDTAENLRVLCRSCNSRRGAPPCG